MCGGRGARGGAAAAARHDRERAQRDSRGCLPTPGRGWLMRVGKVGTYFLIEYYLNMVFVVATY